MRHIAMLLALISLTACDRNSDAIYGSTGLPKNCRAIIQSNVDGWHSHLYSAEEALGNIDRNCGADGLSWGQ